MLSQVRSVGLAFALVVFAGCHMPWQPRNDVPAIEARAQPANPITESSVETTAAGAEVIAATDKRATAEATEFPRPEPTQEEAMTGVLTELQEIGAIDPAAQRTLMDELRKAKLSHWPLITHQFRASLAYREQLADREAPQSQALASRSDASGPVSSTPAAPSSRGALPGSGIGSEPNRVLVQQPAQLASRRAVLRRVESHEMAQTPAQNEPPVETGQTTPLATPPTPPPVETPQAPSISPNNPLRASMPNNPTGPTANEASTVQPAAYQSTPSPPRPDPFDASAAPASLQTSAETAGTWEDQLTTTIERLEQATTDAPATTHDIHRHAVLRMLYLVANRREDALRPIAGISPAQQDYWAKQIFALSTYLDEKDQPDVQRRASAARLQLSEAVSLLGELGTLTVRNLAFCQEVSGFGIYKPIEEPRFPPGQQVTLYAEIENYRSVSTEKGYRTVLATSYEVLDSHGQRVGGGSFPQIEDICQNRRRDFHIQYGVVLPRRIYPGDYTLQLVIQDAQSNKIGRTSTPFEIKE